MKRILVLIGLVLVVVPFLACTESNLSQVQAQPATSATNSANNHQITGSPSLTANFIDQVLARAGSPAQGLGNQFIKLSLQTGIDAAYVLAIFHHESAYGETGVARGSRSPGNMRCLDLEHYGDTGTWCHCEQPGNCYAWFPSWSAGLVATFRLLAGPLYAAGGYTTIERVIRRWAPPADNNDDSAYIGSILQDVSGWRASA